MSPSGFVQGTGNLLLKSFKYFFNAFEENSLSQRTVFEWHSHLKAG
jgi:hypothetical protein